MVASRIADGAWTAWLAYDGGARWIQPEVRGFTGHAAATLADANYPACVLAPEDHPALATALAEARRDGGSRSLAATMVHADGRRRRATVRLDAVTAAAGWLCTITLGRLDQAEFLRQVIDIDPNFVFVKDRAGRFVLVNQALADAYGTAIEDLEGRTDADFTSPEEAEFFRVNDLRVLEDNVEVVIPEEPITHAALGPRWLMTVKRPMLGPDGGPKYLLGVATDITARREAEAERRRIDAHLRETQQLESLGLLAAGVAHDFNNLLTVILGNTNLALRRSTTDAPVVPLLQQIEVATSRAADLCRQLMDYAGQGRGEQIPVSLGDVVTGAARLLELPVGRRAKLELTLTPSLPLVLVDVTQVRQVVMNLVINAAEAIGDAGGTIAIRTFADSPPARLLSSPPAPGATYVCLQVADDGCGMSADTAARIFEPFFSTKFAGRGLGLASVHGIAQAHGGCVDLRTELGRGSTFSLWLPAMRSRA